jgi:hypothetical protein
MCNAQTALAIWFAPCGAAVRLPQAGAARTRCSNGGRLKEKFAALSGRMNKTKSAVAIARRLVGLMLVLAKRRQFYARHPPGGPGEKIWLL